MKNGLSSAAVTISRSGQARQQSAILIGRYSHATFAKVSWRATDAAEFKFMHETNPYRGERHPQKRDQRPFITLSANLACPTFAAMNATLSNNTLLTVRGTGWFAPHYPLKPLTGDRITPIRINQQSGHRLLRSGIVQRPGHR